MNSFPFENFRERVAEVLEAKSKSKFQTKINDKL